MKQVAIALSFMTLAVAGLGVPGAAGKASARTLTWHLVEKDAGFSFIDNPPRQGMHAPPLMGDQFGFRSEMLTRSGKHAGWLNASCFVTTGGTRGSAPCHGAVSFKGGQIMWQALVSIAGDTTEAVIVGGTGVYRGASGYVLSVSRGDNVSDDTFHLTLP